MVPVGSVVMSSRAPIGHLGIATVSLCTNQGCKSFVPGEGVDTHFLYYSLKKAVPAIQTLGSGATFAEVSKSQLQAFEIPLPPLPEQKRIAAILTEQMMAIEKARAAAEARLEAAKALPTAYLREVFESEEAKGWKRKRVGDFLAGPLRTGISKPSLPTSEKECLTLSAVRNGLLDLTAKKPVDVTDREAKGNWITVNAFYVVRGNGNLSLVGRGALAPAAIPEPVLYPDLLIEVIPDPRVVIPDYLSTVWNTREVREDIEGRARTSAGIHKINLKNLGDISIPVPSLDQQGMIAQRMRESVGNVTTLQQGLREEVAAIESLPAALLRRAFAGEL